jgi:hypothetical protein
MSSPTFSWSFLGRRTLVSIKGVTVFLKSQILEIIMLVFALKTEFHLGFVTRLSCNFKNNETVLVELREYILRCSFSDTRAPF